MIISYDDNPSQENRSLFVGNKNVLGATEVFAIACMSACGTSAEEISEKFRIEESEVSLFTEPNPSMLGDSWAEHIITTYMDACQQEENPKRALERFNNAVKRILHWYDCCGTMLTMYAGLEPQHLLPDLASFASTMLVCTKAGLVEQLLAEDVAGQVIEAANTFSVACEYIDYLMQTGNRDDTAVAGQLRAVFLRGVIIES